ncbi:M48 metallopeptidase family protein [Yaniella halotolerans]|uniref:M48 metallopeptidase family protein n=1 Tax=Yaniella halotolerans TaxID=225453 RepID=UPI0003B2F00A|nr:M48 family metallopeptidase [Yaniella halotolerans]
MDTISTLRREDIEQLSGGRISSIVEIGGETVRLISSARRKKTISAKMHDGMIELSVPLRMRDADIVRSGTALISKLKSRQRQTPRSDSELYSRAEHLARVWLGSEVMPTSVVWSDRQTTLWGSCTVATGAIRISTMLHGMPQWVIDGVLVHELAHLKYTDHGQEFRDFAARYPRMSEANAFLDGVSFAQHRGEGKTFPDEYD